VKNPTKLISKDAAIITIAAAIVLVLASVLFFTSIVAIVAIRTYGRYCSTGLIIIIVIFIFVIVAKLIN
jgi:hypothetical protein